MQPGYLVSAQWLYFFLAKLAVQTVPSVKVDHFGHRLALPRPWVCAQTRNIEGRWRDDLYGDYWREDAEKWSRLKHGVWEQYESGCNMMQRTGW